MPSLNASGPVDLKRLREQLAGTTGPRYWRSLEELAGTEEFGAFLADEFPALARLWDTPVSRRTTLKLMAASMALAGLTGCGRQSAEHIVPYVNMPEHLVPGRPRFYATASVIGGYAHGLLAEAHEGRPTKLEGNPDHPATRGACDVHSQASVLSLYDPDRSSGIRERGSIASSGALLSALQQRQGRWDGNGGQGLCILTGTVTSPSEAAGIRAMLQRWPEARWYTHEPIDRDGVYAGSRLLFGRPLEPIYHFHRARVVLALDADFLQSQPGFLRYARDFVSQRRPRDTDRLSRLYVAESTAGITGAYADHTRRIPHPRIQDLARQLAGELGLGVPGPVAPAAPPEWVRAVATDLRNHGANALVVPGDQQPAAVHAIAHAINLTLGSWGTTVEAIPPVAADRTRQGAHGSLADLAQRMHGGQVGSLVVLGSNPVYTAPGDLDFESAYRSVPWRLHWGLYHDETARLSHWHVPAAHALESWADARAYDGTATLIQPLIEPLQGGWTGLQMLAAVRDGVEAEPREALQRYWRNRYRGPDFELYWRRALQKGIVPETASTPVRVQRRRDWTTRLPAPAPPPNGRVLLQFRPDPAIRDGSDANNGWLQELPAPLTKLTWDNALLIGPALAEEYALGTGDLVEVTVEQRARTFPVYVLPGQPAGAATLHLGHGRTSAGRVGTGVGENAYVLRPADTPWATEATLNPTGGHRELAVTQDHHAIEGRDLIRAADLTHYRAHPDFAHEGAHPPAPEESLYPEPWPGQQDPANAWAMVIDLSACIGCNACVTACQAENNIPVVGRDEVRRGREMHWIRIDRYFEGVLDAPRMVFQPVTCMHCENAPCEYVCPVEATQHSADGLNEMIYNRCIGTRYCSQNCPYKVRVFNWFDYSSRAPQYPAEPAPRNPDVTVRAEGVMEKCTYCVQRIRRVQQQAGADDRPIADGEVVTACAQACPTRAIVFGDMKDPKSEVRRLRGHRLNYGMLADLNTRPRTTYLAAVRNTGEPLRGEEG